MTKVLVASASKHGSTEEIADAIASVLREYGLEVEDCHGELIATRPTWLFSSGPIGDPAHVPVQDSFDAADLVRRIHARDHRQFGGKLVKAQLSIGERAAAGLLRVPAGDYRQWDAITAWATAIGRFLTADLLV
jgi:hypothetical protein